MTTATEGSQPDFSVPEPDLTPDELIARATAMRPLLLEEQAATEERGAPAPEAHQQLIDTGLYRIIQPRRFGGYEFSMEDTFKAIMEVARGCPSTGWHYGFMCLHGVAFSELFGERAQTVGYGRDGVFLAPGRIPMGTAEKVDDGWLLNGVWDYCSGAPYGNFFLPNAILKGVEGPPQIVTAVVPREQWTMLDDWGDVLGLRGTGSNSIKVENELLPDWAVVDQNLISVDMSRPLAGYELHGNPQYAGRLASLVVSELSSWGVGVAKAMLDEYEEMMRTRMTGFPPPSIPRFEHHDYQRNAGLALGLIDAAEAIVLRNARDHVAYATRGVEGGEPFTVEEDLRLMLRYQQAFQMCGDAIDLLFRSGGTLATRDGSRSQRYFRDFSMARTHAGQQIEPSAQRVMQVRYGMPTIFG